MLKKNPDKNISVVIPTYNEAENIEKLINELFKLKSNISIIVVDDNSPDGTGSIAEKLKANYPEKLFVIHKEIKTGLGSAYIEGFKKALELENNLVVTMDADFSHDPKKILSFADKIAEGYDVAIGSRYISGGAVNWKLGRRILSKGANFLTNIILNLGINDVTSGFRCYKKNVLEKINFDKINSQGYSFLEEMLFICKKNKFKIAEVPIIFNDRKEGKSKLSKIEMMKFFFTLIRLRFS